MHDSGPGVVLWDADGVLQRAAPGWRDHLLGIGGETFVDDLMEAEVPCLRGEQSFADAIAQVLRRHRIQASVSSVVQPWLPIVVDHQALAVVDVVRAGGRRCYLATNQQDVRCRVMRETLPYADHLDGEFYSCELGAAKPDSGFFTAILRTLDVAAGDVLFIDDSERNVVAAAALGIAAECHDPAAGAAGLRSLLARHGIVIP